MATQSTQILKLASAGNEIKIWDSSNFSLCHSFSSKIAPSFRTTHWSPDFRQIVSVPSSGKQILLTLVKDTALQHMDFSTNEENTVAKFSSTSSRVLGIGTKSGNIHIWNIRNRKINRTYLSEKSEVTSMQFNVDDSYLASGYANGIIVLHNNTTGQSNSPITVARGETIKSLQYSYYKKSLLGCASEDGMVSLWDCNTRQMIHSFQPSHVAPASDLCFSPLNTLLLTSVGLDKNVICYDIQTKKVIRTMECDVPLTSVQFKEDGVTLAVGSTRGRILIFDLRSPLYPFHTISAHDNYIHSLSFQNSVTGVREKLSKKPALSKSDVGKYYKPAKSEVCNENTSADAFVSNAEVSTGATRGSLTTELFSPLRDIPSTIPVRPSQVLHEGVSGDQCKSDTLDNSEQMLRDGSLATVFSPLQDQRMFQNNFEQARTSLPGDKHFVVNQCGPPGSEINSAAPPNAGLTLTMPSNSPKAASPLSQSPMQWPLEKPLFPPSVNCMRDLSCLTFKGICLSKNVDSEAGTSGGRKIDPINEINDGASVMVTPPTLEDRKSLPVVEDCLKGTTVGSMHSNIDFIDEGRGTGGQTTPMTPQAFHSEYIRQVITDAMEEHSDAMRRYFHMSHVQMCRQMEMQKEQIETLFSRYSVDADLLSQVVELKKENQFLKHTFR